MIKIIMVLGCMGIVLHASEKKTKDIYTADQLYREVGRKLEEYKKNKETMRNDVISRGKRVNFDSSVQGDAKSDQPKNS